MSEWKGMARTSEEEAGGPVVQVQSKSKVFFKKFMQRRTAVVVAVFPLILLVIIVASPGLAPYDPAAPDYGNLLGGPSPAHILGTGEYGRDVLNRLTAGSHLTLGVLLSSVITGAAIGTFLGILIDYHDDILETLVMCGSDVLLASPDIPLVIAIVAIIGPGIINIVVTVAVFTVPSFACTMCSVALSVKESPYMEVAWSTGYKNGRILSIHIFPGTVQAMIINFIMHVGTATLAVASLSPLGLDANAAEPD